MNKKQMSALARIIAGAICFIIVILLPLEGLWKLIAFLIPYLVIGGDVLYKALRNIFRGHLFDENFLMGIATIGAFFVSDYAEAVSVMLFYQIGEFFQGYAVNKSRKSISSLMDIRPDYANIEINGSLQKVEPCTISVGDRIIVKPGEKIPLDGIIKSGSSMVDTSALTGESVPREIYEGDACISGCINLNGTLDIEVTKTFGESTVSKILDLVENAGSRKSNSENFITRFAQVYTPIVVIAAALLAVLPPLLFGGEWSSWIHKALIFLVISCPCALVISVPLSFFGGIGGASRKGILIKGSNYIEALSKVKTVVFDKTGTLTRGTFNVTEIHPEGMSEEELLYYTVHAEAYSDHPISLSLKKAYGKVINQSIVAETNNMAGLGISATIENKTVLAGNAKLMKNNNINFVETNTPGTVIYVAVDIKYAGYILISDEIKETSKAAIAELKKEGICKTVMLTGDSNSIGNYVATELGIDDVHTELLPADKVEKLEQLIEAKPSNSNLAFVGDGINDAPVLARADIGIAMGSMGSDAAIESADIVLMDDNPLKISEAIKIARKTLRIVTQNIYFALSIKAIFLILGAFGIANMWEAVFADVGVSVIAILNAMRALRS